MMSKVTLHYLVCRFYVPWGGCFGQRIFRAGGASSYEIKMSDWVVPFIVPLGDIFDRGLGGTAGQNPKLSRYTPFSAKFL